MKYIPFTPEGYKKLQKEYDELKQNRIEAVSELKRARELGDLSENAAYKVARQRLSSIDRRIQHAGKLIRYAQVIHPRQDGSVDIGTSVKVEGPQGPQQFEIVGGFESDPLHGKISHLSPLGKALMGKKKGDKISVTVPNGIHSYLVLAVQ